MRGEFDMKANSYKLKDDVTMEQLIELGFKDGSWLVEDKSVECVSKSIGLGDSIELNLVIKTNPMEFDDYEDVLVLDDDFCQPYTPFYGDNYKRDIKDWNFLEKVIRRYNEEMDKSDIFEIIKEEK